jgi:hypothetical protein
MLSGIGEAPGGKGGGTRASIWVPGMFSSRAAAVISQRGYATPLKAIDGRWGRRAEFPIRYRADGSAPVAFHWARPRSNGRVRP